jgi:hypothetical protein
MTVTVENQSTQTNLSQCHEPWQGQKEQQEGGVEGDPKFAKYEIQGNNSLGRQYRLLPDTREYSSSAVFTISINIMKLQHTI